MLRTETSRQTLYLLWAACAIVGVLAALLVDLGNPGNMGICGACFLRDTAGAFGLSVSDGPRIFRPELAGIILGAFVFRLGQRRLEGRAGSHAGPRFFLGMWMGIGALVFLGCPFRMLQRIGGADLNAVVGAVGFIVGVGVGLFFERRGYSVGKTSVVNPAAGTPALLLAIGGIALFAGGLMPFGPGPIDTTGKPPHAPWMTALGVALIAGALLSWTGFCAVTAARQVFIGPRKMLVGAALLIAGYAVVAAVTGRFQPRFENQPISHEDHLWSILALSLVGLTGVMAGGCPVRQLVIAGEGNGDALVTAGGIMIGCSLAHALKLVSTTAGATERGRIAVLFGLGICLAYAVAVTWWNRRRALAPV
jgi:YedE family putative selenium metabolism protein